MINIDIKDNLVKVTGHSSDSNLCGTISGLTLFYATTISNTNCEQKTRNNVDFCFTMSAGDNLYAVTVLNDIIKYFHRLEEIYPDQIHICTH